MKREWVLFGLIGSAVSAMAMGGWDGKAPLAHTKVSFKVVDTDGIPVSAALVSASFFHRDPDRSRRYESLTDTNGLCTLEGEGTGQLAYWISKEGFYESEGNDKRWMTAWRPPNSPNIVNGRWQPWNPVFEVVLKPIKNPIPMYVKRVETKIPVEGKPVGFDFEKGGWLVPYGPGEKSDVLFLLTRGRAYENDFECSLYVSFQNEGDGLHPFISMPVSSRSLRLPHAAPQTGYFPRWEKDLFMKPDGRRQNLEEKEDHNYFFRIRTVLDENRNIKSALYGKIHGDIHFYGYIADKVTLIFTYYLNPEPNDRNVEFDPERNLFGGRDRFAP